MKDIFMDLWNRIFTHTQTSITGLGILLVTWLSTNGIELSLEHKGQLIAAIGALIAALFKFLSKDKGGKAQ